MKETILKHFLAWLFYVLDTVLRGAICYGLYWLFLK